MSFFSHIHNKNTCTCVYKPHQNISYTIVMHACVTRAGVCVSCYEKKIVMYAMRSRRSIQTKTQYTLPHTTHTYTLGNTINFVLYSCGTWAHTHMHARANELCIVYFPSRTHSNVRTIHMYEMKQQKNENKDNLMMIEKRGETHNTQKSECILYNKRCDCNICIGKEEERKI